MRGHQLDKDYIEQNGFRYPILVKDAAGLDLKVPNSDFTVADVELAVGELMVQPFVNTNLRKEKRQLHVDRK